MEDWDIVTHSSRVSISGRARNSTTSASIRWIRLNYTYLDESCRVLVYCLGGHYMLRWRMYNWLWKCIWLHDKNIFLALAYPSVVCCMFRMCDFLFLRWSSIYWWEQMRETSVVNREVMVPLRSPPELDSTVLGFIIGLWSMYWLVL